MEQYLLMELNTLQELFFTAELEKYFQIKVLEKAKVFEIISPINPSYSTYA